MFDARNKLEILAVNSGLKDAFFAEGSKGWNNLLSLKRLAMKIGLHCKSTRAPPFYFSKIPNVDDNFLRDYYQNENIESLWIYDNIEVESKIIKCLSGQLNEGYILGYPECCIRWHEGCRVIEVEETFNETRTCIKSDYKKEKEWQRKIDNQLFETWKKYPFVPHWACSDCLRGKSQKTEQLNNKYKELAVSIGFEKIFLYKVKTYCQQIGQN